MPNLGDSSGVLECNVVHGDSVCSVGRIVNDIGCVFADKVDGTTVVCDFANSNSNSNSNSLPIVRVSEIMPNRVL